MKVAVYTIALNEAHFIERWAKSCEEADYRLIVDTGSTDNTLEVAELNGCHTGSIIVRPWRFDDARNAALALLPDDIDYCISLDADEVLMPGWRQAFDKLDSKVTRPRYKYVWSSNPDGSERLTFGGDKIHARHGYRWTHPVHEIITPTGEEVQGWVDVDMRHYPDPTKSRGQYLPLLELSVKEDPNDDRNLFYLGREYMFHNRYEDAIPRLLKHLEMSTWAPERATGMRYLARCTGNKEHWLLRSCAEAPERREPWNDLAFFYYEQRNWASSYSAALKALAIKEKPMEYLCEPEAWGSTPHDLAGVAAWNMGLKSEGIFHTVNAVKTDPSDSRIKNNLAMMYKDLRKTDVCAIIPSKSNMDGLIKVVDLLKKEQSVSKIIIVADGEIAYENICNLIPNPHVDNISIYIVDEGSGIHVMWNAGMNDGYHNLFINDDVTFEPGSMDILAGMLDYHKELGIVCPNYDSRFIKDIYQSVSIACPGNYDGTDGLAGFCMMLDVDLSAMWEFDETMKWYYGDNDVLNWVRQQGFVGAISGVTQMDLNPSWTKTNDPPKDFDSIVLNDKLIFDKKWKHS
jgi:glycosyltransferase involved in cell wall biosynthesis